MSMPWSGRGEVGASQSAERLRLILILMLSLIPSEYSPSKVSIAGEISTEDRARGCPATRTPWLCWRHLGDITARVAAQPN